MTEDEAKHFRQRALIRAREIGVSRMDCFDIAQDVATSFVKKGPGQTVDQAVIDALRIMFGRNGKKREQEIVVFKKFNAARRSSAAWSKFCRDTLWDVVKEISDPVHRAAVMLRYGWGFELSEIGECFGYSESWACKKVKDAIESMEVCK